MELKDLDDILEAILFVSGDGLSIEEICNILELQKSEINSAIERLQKKFSGKRGIHLIKYNNKIQFGTNPIYKEQVSIVLNPIKEKELSSAALETIAIIAYKQPITRLEVETIRGVNCDYAISVLLNHKLIEVVGRRDAVGKPLLFGTTEAFLKRFRLDALEQLPDYEQLLDSIKVIEDKYKPQDAAVSMYNEYELPPESTSEEASNNEDEDLIDAESEVAATTDEPKKKKGKASKKQIEQELEIEEELPDFLKDEKDLQKIE